jgi:cardiolipin synthase
MSAGETIALVLAAVDILFRLTALVIVPRNRRPQTSMAWLLAIFFIPFFAFLVFLAFGSHRLSPKRLAKQDTIRAFLDTRSGLPQITKAREDIEPLVSMNKLLGQMDLTRGNSAEFLTDYQESLHAMVKAIDEATKTVHVEFYIMAVDESTTEIFAALYRAKNRGVDVRVLFDQLATRRVPGSKLLTQTLDQMGIDYRAMLPIQPWRGVYQRPDIRNHRKLLVVDSTIAFTGSQNIIDSAYHRRGQKNLHWLDLMVTLHGPIVDDIEAMFITDWFHETNVLLDLPRSSNDNLRGSATMQLVPSGPAVEGESNLRMFNHLMYQAQKHITIVSPYLVPDDSMRYAITSAALRGVAVNVFVSEAGDQPTVFYAQRSYYEELLRAGVRIWLYPSPTVLHSKFLVVDDRVAVMGTSNLDMRSFSLNLELSLMLISAKEIESLEAIAADYQGKSRELSLDEWNRRGQATRFIEGLARVTATVQ